MTETTATDTLIRAWADRYDAAHEDLRCAEEAPALVKPERFQELQDEAAKALAQYRYWVREDAGR